MACIKPAMCLCFVILAQGKVDLSPLPRGRLGGDVSRAPPSLRDSSAELLLQEDEEIGSPAQEDEPQAEQQSSQQTDEGNGSCATGGDFPALDAGDPYLVPLRREATPVYRGEVIVSYKTSYSGRISLGSSDDKQDFRVVFDTGSGHVVVPSNQCNSETCLAHKRYNISKSSTGKAINLDGQLVVPGKMRDQVTVGFGTGKIVGRFVHEEVCLDLGSDSRPCLPMKVITALSMTPQPFQSFKFDGIVGLGLLPLALSDTFSFFDMLSNSLRKGGGEDQPAWSRFGVYLSEGSGDPLEEASEIAFGGYNPKRIVEPLRWVPTAMASAGYWQVEIHELRLGNNSLDICKDVVCRGIVDTGTSHLGVPGSVYEQVALALTVPAGDLESCTGVTGDIMEIKLDGFSLELRPEDYMRPLPLAPGVNPGSRMPGDDSAFAEPDRPIGADIANGGNTCRPKLMPVNMPEPMGPYLFILGEPLLKRYYAAFDWKEQKVGFARSAKPDVFDRNDGSIMMQRGVGVEESIEDDIMWQGDDNSFMVQMNVGVEQVDDVPLM